MYFNPQTPAVAARQAIEKTIVLSAVDELLAQGYLHAVDDGEERFTPTTDRKQLVDQLLNTDEDYIFVHAAADEEPIGWLRFIYGNDGWDVLSDYTVDLESLLPKTLALIEKLAA